MTTENFNDGVLKNILTNAPFLNQEQRADIFDHFADTPVEFAKYLHPLPIPDRFKGELIAQRIAQPWAPPKQATPEDKVVEAINTLKTIDPAILKVAEGHGLISKLFVEAALQDRG